MSVLTCDPTIFIPIDEQIIFPHQQRIVNMAEYNDGDNIFEEIRNNKITKAVIGFISPTSSSDSNIIKFGMLSNIKLQDKSKHLLIQGISRVQIDGEHIEFNEGKGVYYIQKYDTCDWDIRDNNKLHEYAQQLYSEIERLCTSSDITMTDLNLPSQIKTLEHAVQIINMLLTTKDDYKLLIDVFSTSTIEELLLALSAAIREKMLSKKKHEDLKIDLNKQIEQKLTLPILQKFMDEIKDRIHKLGDYPFDEGEDEYTTIIQKIKKKITDYPDMLDHFLSEAKKLKNSHAQDAAVLHKFLDYILSIPWDHKNKTTSKIETIINTIKENIYGEEETLEILKTKLPYQIHRDNTIDKDKKSHRDHRGCLLFVGPPGIGKTAIAESIAKAQGREVIFLSLSGIRDKGGESLKGHRKTYIGAMAGKIVENITRGTSMNPVMVLDELDKLDPSLQPMMLDLLDNRFYDEYVAPSINFPLEDFQFIFTANDPSLIIPPLRDRLFLIQMQGHTDEEIAYILEHFSLPKILKKENLSKTLSINIDKSVYKEISENVFGMRQAEEYLRTIIGKALYYELTKQQNNPKDNKKSKYIVNLKNIKNYIPGGIKKGNIPLQLPSISGRVHALYVSYCGGGTMIIESNLLNKSRSLDKKVKPLITQSSGNISKVMQESINNAFAFVECHSQELGINWEDFNDHVLYFNIVPAAVQKDGPSAGIAFTVAIVSKLLNIKVENTFGYTGEIDTCGYPHRIGGVNFKLAGARRTGLKTIFIPESNREDAVHCIKKWKDHIEVYAVNSIYDVLYYVLGIGENPNLQPIIETEENKIKMKSIHPKKNKKETIPKKNKKEIIPKKNEKETIPKKNKKEIIPKKDEKETIPKKNKKEIIPKKKK